MRTTFHVYLNGKLIDTVRAARGKSCADVRRNLVLHAGLPPNITVKKG